MLRVSQIEDVDEIVHKWPRILTLAADDKLPFTHEGLLQVYLTALSRGAVFGVYGDSGMIGTCCAVIQDSYARILLLPSSKGGKLPIDLECVKAIEDWARDNELVGIRVVTLKLNGSSLAYFGNRLGFKRESVTFVKDI